MKNINVTSANGTTQSMTSEELENLLSCVTKVKDVSFNGSRFFYYVGDNFIVELSMCDGFLDYKNSLMNEWKRHGFITERFESYLHTNTYYCKDGKCSGKYNVMDKNSKVDFDYLLENTEDNIKFLVAKCIQRMKSGII